MTERDPQQIRQLVSEEITSRLDRAVEALKASQDRAVEELKTNPDRAVESLIGNISDLRTETMSRFDQVDRQFLAVNNHLDRIDTRLAAYEIQTLGMSRSLTTAEKLDIAITTTQSGQQRAIDQLYVEIAEIKRRLDRPPQ